MTMALPWLESLPAFAADSPDRQPGRRTAGPHGRDVCRQRLSQQRVVDQGRRTRHGAGQGARTARPMKEKLLLVRGLYNAEAGKGGIHRRRPATCSPAPRWKGAAASARASAWIKPSPSGWAD